ncbi:LIM domain-containing protein WLIM1-like [Senna tora]|uniref:LIM domain-containing protein WLIM1-like n=1 Tax=Senna tora TaxID=362788 RepID=A0A834SNT6_9FABA|nr:LIM domain-containing protein WLIM1-like [Senna tora]
MATFAGTTQKCKACEKTVYVMDQLTADNKIYHRFCFRCHHCKGTLKLSNFSSFEGVLYCKPHYDQLYKMTGSLEKSFEGEFLLSVIGLLLISTPRTARVVRSADQVQTNGKVSRLFAGTQEKCVSCNKTVYPIEKNKWLDNITLLVPYFPTGVEERVTTRTCYFLVFVLDTWMESCDREKRSLLMANLTTSLASGAPMEAV